MAIAATHPFFCYFIYCMRPIDQWQCIYARVMIGRIPSENAKTVRWHSQLWLQFSVMCSSTRAYEPAGSGNLFIEQRPRPRPENCTTGCFALPLLHQHHRFALLGHEGTHQFVVTTRQRRSEDGRPTGAERGGATVLGGGIGGLSFSAFVSLMRLILLVAHTEGVGARALPPSPLLGQQVRHGLD